MVRLRKSEFLRSIPELANRPQARVVQTRIAPAGWRLRTANLDPRTIEIDVLPLEPSDLARAQSAVERECSRDVREDPIGPRTSNLEQMLLLVISKRFADRRF